MYRILVTLTIISSLVLSQLNAQTGKGEEFFDGWAVTKKGDTLRGKISYRNGRTGEIYQQDKKLIIVDTVTGAKKKYGHEKLQSFSCDGKLFEFISLDPNLPPFMMQKVIDGDALLYKAWFVDDKSTNQKFSYEEVTFIKKKTDTQFTEVMEKGFKKTMKEFFAGDGQILELIKNNNWGVKDLEKIVTAYNELE
ncbi:MAG: hypothetical protein K1X77_09465 [Bacteroidia bacterium]|nr:hypothetical protein [Bacteroidia bacterium]